MFNLNPILYNDTAEFGWPDTLYDLWVAFKSMNAFSKTSYEIFNETEVLFTGIPVPI